MRGIQLAAGIGIANWLYDDLAVGFEGRLDARLCSEAQHGQILVSDPVLRLVTELVRAESMV